MIGPPWRWAVGDVVVEGQRIRRLGRAESLPGDEVIDAKGLWIVPGFINAHLHSHDVFLRARYEALPLERAAVFLNPSIHAPLTPQEIYIRTGLVAAEMLRAGFTSCIDTIAFHPLDPEHVVAAMRAYSDIGMRAWVGPRLMDRPSLEPDLLAVLPEAVRDALIDQNALDSGAASALLQELLPRCDGRVKIAPMPSSPFRCSDHFIQAMDDFSRQHDLPWQIHVLETRAQSRAALRFPEGSMVSHLAALGVLSPRCGVVHAVWASRQELEQLGAAGAVVLHNPVSNLRLGSGVASLAGMRAAGLTVALGSDNASCARADPFEVMRTAAWLSQVADQILEAPASFVVAAATAGGARACLQPGTLGTLRDGAVADIVMLDPSIAFAAHGADPLQHLVYHLDSAAVRNVMVDGRLVIQAGRITTVDEGALRAEAEQVAARVTHDHERVAMRGRHILELLSGSPATAPDVREGP